MATTTVGEKTTSYQPVFPEQYPKKCHRCKTPTVCEKLVIRGQKEDACIFICPKDAWPRPAKTKRGQQR